MKKLITTGNYSLKPIQDRLSDYDFSPVGTSFVGEEDVLKVLNGLSLTKRMQKISNGCFKRIYNDMRTCFSIQDTLSKNRVDGAILHAAAGLRDNAIAKVCNKLDIPTFIISNGFWPDNIEKSFYKGNTEPRHILCTSDYMKDQYIKLGAKEKLVMTGSPYFDGYKDFIRKKDGDVTVLIGFEILMVNSLEAEAVLPMFYTPSVKYNNYFSMYKVAKKLPDFKFIIKVKSFSAFKGGFFDDAPDNVEIVDSGYSMDILDKVDVVVGANSTLMAEAIFCGIPTITPKYDFDFYKYMGSVMPVEWEVDKICKAIKNSIGSIINNEEFNNYFFSHNLDFKATDRVENFIRGVIDES